MEEANTAAVHIGSKPDTTMDIKTVWPAHMKNTRNIGDFRHWKDHDAYQKSFARLLRDLKATEAKRA